MTDVLDPLIAPANVVNNLRLPLRLSCIKI
jgi:hypothetical protein